VTSKSVAALIMAALVAACNGENTTGPGTGGGNPTLFAQAITLPQFENILSAGPARVEIKLIEGTLVAREVEVEEAEEMLDEEEVESRVTAISSSNMTLAFGGLVVDFDGNTKFEAEDGQDLSMQEFINRVQAALNAGENPPVEAKRPPAATPQDPDVATFLATKIEFDDEADEDELKINVDGDNLSTNATPPPDAILRVLNLPIELDVSGGRTELESEIDDDTLDETEFESLVESVSGSTVTLTNGMVVTIVDDTEFDDCDDADELCSLTEVQTALAMGFLVEADGEGVVTGTGPLSITASKVEFEIEDDDDDLPGTIEFQGAVTSVDVSGRTLTLASGTVVAVSTDQIIDPLGDLFTLQAAADAIAAGANVRAEGDAELVDAGPPRQLNALAIKIEDDT